ncbi:MAG: Lrp/AsnC family transcriptional regulator [Proteobacteria bacterium]|nr:Lrp/AsnC family transcriptional regulator [Pseudomonadota bacterium]
MKIDDTDIGILDILQTNSNITNTQLASEIGISPPAMLERVKRLENSGLVKGYVALVDHEKAGQRMMAFVSVSLAIHEMQSVDGFTNRIGEIDEVLECYHIAGEEDFLLKVVVNDIKEYRSFVMDKLTIIPGVSKIKTTFVLASIKQETKIRINR